MGGNNGNVLGSPTWSSGDITLDGNDDKIVVNDNDNLDGPSHTFEIWFTMPDSGSWVGLNAYPRLIDKIPVPALDSGTNLAINQSTRAVQVYFTGSSWSNVTVGSSASQFLISSNTLSYSTKYHIVFTYDNSTKLGQIYVNDVLVASGTTSGSYIPNTTNLVIGGISSDDTRNIRGIIHRAAVYNKALSSTEISDNYAAGSDFNFKSVSGSNSTATSSKSTIYTTGGDNAIITVTAKDSNSNPVSGAVIVLSSSRGATDTIVPSSAVSDVNGQATFTVSSSTGGSPVFSATANGFTITQTVPITVAVDPAVVSASLSTITATFDSIPANGTTTSTITITVNNGLSSPLSGKTVTLSSSRGATDTITTILGTSDTNGQAQFTVKSGTAGSPVFTAVADGITITNTKTITYTSGIIVESNVGYTSTLDSLAMKMDVAYDGSKTSAPILLVLSGYSSTLPDGIINRLAEKGLFAIRAYKRGYGSSAGTSDDSARENYDFVDAVEYVKSHYGQYVDTTNINVVGYSGGGGNTYGLMTKFPDYFRTAQVFFGMSDYGYDDTYGWYNIPAASGYQSLMQTRIGGTPSQVRNNYYARAHYLGAKNNPYTHIQLFYDTSETLVPPSNATQYTTVSDAAGFTNVVTRISDATSTTPELSEDFSSALSGWTALGAGATDITRNAGGYLDWSTDNGTVFDVLSKKLNSYRLFLKTSHFKSSFTFTKSASGVAIIGFRNSANSTLINSAAILIMGNSLYLRIDYSSGVRDVQIFTTAVSPSTTYKMDLEINNGVLTGTLKNSSDTVLETKTLNFDGVKVFDGVDSFGIYNFNSGGAAGTMTGTFDDLNIISYSRWGHNYPTASDPTVSAENYFVSDIVAGTYSNPTLLTSGTMFIPGYVKTNKFYIMLGSGTDEAGNLTYNISGNGNSATTAKTFTVEGLTGTANVALNVYNLTASTQYAIVDNNLTDGGTTSTTATTNSSGTLTYTGTIGSTHRYDVYTDSVGPTISSVVSTPAISSTTITWTTNESASSKVDYGLTNSYGSSTTETDTSTRVTNHSVSLSSLATCTTYHYRVRSKDAALNETVDSDNTFTTIGCSSTGLSSPTGYTKDDNKPTLIFKKPATLRNGITSYTITLDSGKNRSFSSSGIPSSGNGSSYYLWKDDSSVKIEFYNENDSDQTNDEIHVYFKDLDKQELSEGKHTWTVTAYDPISTAYSQSADFYLDKTSPSVSELAVANVSTVKSGGVYSISILNRTPSFSGLASDNYQGSTVTNSNGTKDTFDKVSSGPQTITLTFKKLKNGQDPSSATATYENYLTKDFSLTDIQDTTDDKKSGRFYITTPYPLVDGYYQVTIVLKDSAGNSYDQPIFYASLNTGVFGQLLNVIDNNGSLETKITKKEEIPAKTEEEKQQVKENGYTVKIKVVDTKNQPVAGAKVTIHSKVQETTTDKNGLAQFSNVESGQHKINIAYANYQGEQTVNLTGDVKEFDLNIQVKQTNAFLNPQVITVIGIMAFIILITVVLLIKAKRKG